MPNIVSDAQHRTAEIIAEADLAVELLSGYERPRSNALGVLADPSTFMLALASARAAVDRAMVIHAGTTWPTDTDYNNG